MANLTQKVEISFTTSPDNPAPVWTDISSKVLVVSPITITKGRQDQFSSVQAGIATVTLDNSDGRFSPGRAASPYYPNIVLYRRLRISVTDGVTTWVRFDGRVDGWPVRWAPTGFYSEAVITVIDRFKALSGTQMLNMVSEEIMSDAPDGYWPLGDPEGTTTAADVSGVGAFGDLNYEKLGTSASNIVFGQGTGSGFDGMSTPTFTQAGGGVSAAFLRSVTMAGFNTGANNSATVGCTISGFTAGGHIIYLSLGTTINSPKIGIINSGGNTILVLDDGMGGVDNVISAIDVSDGLTHDLMFRFNSDPGGAVMSLYIDGNGIGTTVSTIYTTLPTFNALTVGASPGSLASNFTGNLSHVRVFSRLISATRILPEGTMVTTGYDGELPGARVARIARYAGVNTAEVSVETGASPLDWQNTTGKSYRDAIGDVETTELGVAFINREGDLVFHGRAHRWNQAAPTALTAGQYQDDIEAILDDYGVTNDVTVTRGSDYPVSRQMDATSIAAIGPRPAQIDGLFNSTSATAERAQWELNQHSTPTVRWPSVTVDLMTQTSIRAAVLALDVGSRLSLAGLPSTGPATSVDLLVEGYSETTGVDVHTITFNCSAYSPDAIWTLDDPVYGVLDAGNILAL